jgi:surface polysaccharide O-acyltransferase-like enzyme
MTTQSVPLEGMKARPVAASPVAAGARLLFVDNIRVLLTVLVIVFHLMIIYAGTGSWYYTEGRQDAITGALGAWFLVVNQAYFMGLFLLISAYFVPGSYDRKGPGHFLKDRLIRLGIPLVLYSWVIRPAFIYADPIKWQGARPPFLDYFPAQYFRDESLIGAGPLWFIETLLIFSAFYVLWRLATRSHATASAVDTQFPGNGSIALFALLLGLASFLVRLWLPLGYNFEPLNLQFPFFPQYIALFIIGLIAYRRNWLLTLPDVQGRLWLGISVLLIFGFWPMAILGGMDKGIENFAGSWHWQALVYALWESFLCLSMCIGLIYAFRRYRNSQGALSRFLARNAYTAYLIHGVVITAVAYTIRDISLYPLLKWALVALVAVPLCFAISSLIRKLPYTERVL